MNGGSGGGVGDSSDGGVGGGGSISSGNNNNNNNKLIFVYNLHWKVLVWECYIIINNYNYQSEPTNAHNFTKITLVLQYTDIVCRCWFEL